MRNYKHWTVSELKIVMDAIDNLFPEKFEYAIAKLIHKKMRDRTLQSVLSKVKYLIHNTTNKEIKRIMEDPNLHEDFLDWLEENKFKV